MSELELTETQRDRLEEIRADIEAAFVDEYGHTRLRDALQYLLDTYTPPGEGTAAPTGAYDRIATAEYPALQQIAADVPEVPGSGIDADEMRGRLLRELGPEAFATRLASAAGDERADPTTETRKDGDTGPDAEPATIGDGADGAPATTDATDDDNDSGGLLSTANRLLDEYADVWRENDEGDEPYAVDLPDGTTETVRTKDDVRKLLFQHYS